MRSTLKSCSLEPRTMAYYSVSFLGYYKFHYHTATFLQGFFHFHTLNKVSLTKIKTRVDLNLIIPSTFEQLTFSKSRICLFHYILGKQGCQLVSRLSAHHLCNSLLLWYTPLKILFMASRLVAVPFHSYFRVPPLHFAERGSKCIVLLLSFNLICFLLNEE